MQALNQPILDSLGHALDVVCSRCSGTGETWTGYVTTDPAAPPVMRKCDSCNGTGYVLTATGRTLLTFIRRHS